jgi:alpha-tubulin suppressor-like RCC1 family protein
MYQSMTTSPRLRVRRLAKSQDGSGQSIGVTSDGVPYTWGRTNSLGQLGRPSGDKSKPSREPHPAQFVDSACNDPVGLSDNVRVVRGYAGGNSEAGHTAVVDTNGHMWLAGSDRWQQLGLVKLTSSIDANLGATGYTWDGLWKDRFHKNTYVTRLLQEVTGGDGTIRDVAIGGDHTLVLSANRKDVIAFGKGGEGQLGLTGKPWVSAPIRSKELSSKKEDIAAVCAINHCSLTLGDDGQVLTSAGKCSKRISEGFAKALQYCQRKAEREGLLTAVKDTCNNGE